MSRDDTAPLRAVERSCGKFSAVVLRTVGNPVTCGSTMTCINAGAVVPSSERLSAVQRRWERPAAPNPLPFSCREAALADVRSVQSSAGGVKSGIGSAISRQLRETQKQAHKQRRAAETAVAEQAEQAYEVFVAHWQPHNPAKTHAGT